MPYEPGFLFGDIYTNVINGTLDNTNGVPSALPDDVSFALGHQCYTYGGKALSGGVNAVVNGYGSFAWGQQLGSHARSSFAQAFGRHSYAYCSGQSSFSSVINNAWSNGSAQRAAYLLAIETTTNTPAELTTSAASPIATNRLYIKPGRTYAFRIKVSARQVAGAAGTAGDSACWFIEGCIKRDLANNTLLVGVPTGTGAPTFNDVAAAAWTVAVTADDVNESLVITVTGEVSKTIRWSADIPDAEAGRDT